MHHQRMRSPGVPVGPCGWLVTLRRARFFIARVERARPSQGFFSLGKRIGGVCRAVMSSATSRDAAGVTMDGHRRAALSRDLKVTLTLMHPCHRLRRPVVLVCSARLLTVCCCARAVTFAVGPCSRHPRAASTCPPCGAASGILCRRRSTRENRLHAHLQHAHRLLCPRFKESCCVALRAQVLVASHRPRDCI